MAKTTTRPPASIDVGQFRTAVTPDGQTISGVIQSEEGRYLVKVSSLFNGKVPLSSPITYPVVFIQTNRKHG